MSDESREELLAELYAELRRRAGNVMRGQPAEHTLQPTALVHEAYLKLCGDDSGWEDRRHFLAAASQAMRHGLVDHARGRTRQKRTPPGEKVPLDRILVTYEDRALDLLALDEALTRLAEADGDMAKAVELRFFGGLSMEETAKVLEMPKRSLERRWKATRAWLHAEVV